MGCKTVDEYPVRKSLIIKIIEKARRFTGRVALSPYVCDYLSADEVRKPLIIIHNFEVPAGNNRCNKLTLWTTTTETLNRKTSPEVISISALGVVRSR